MLKDEYCDAYGDFSTGSTEMSWRLVQSKKAKSSRGEKKRKKYIHDEASDSDSGDNTASYPLKSRHMDKMVDFIVG